MAKSNPGQFVREVRQEMAKVTWPTRQETMVSVLMVCIMAVLAALYFVGVDSIIRMVIRWIMSV